MKRKRKGKIWFFVVLILIALLTYTTLAGASSRYGDAITPQVRGVDEIRFGVDVVGGQEITFVPADGSDVTADQMSQLETSLTSRMAAMGITDYEIYRDLNHNRTTVRYVWPEEGLEYTPAEVAQELGATGFLTLREGNGTDAEGNPTGATILTSADVTAATSTYGVPTSTATAEENYVQLTLSETAATAYADATTRLAANEGTISVWMDNEMVSEMAVTEANTTGSAIVTGSFTEEEAQALADTITSGSLPYNLKVESYSAVNPVVGSNAMQTLMVIGIVAIGLVCLFMILSYRLVGFVASIALIGQIAATLALVSHYFVVFKSFTLTLPGVAGLVLCIGMGVAVNIGIAERIKEELRDGKKLDVAIRTGYSRTALVPATDTNVAMLLVAAVLICAFGPSGSAFTYPLYPIFFAFRVPAAASIYSLGYVLFWGIMFNFLFGIFASRVMLTSLSKFGFLRKAWLFSGPSEKKEPREPKRTNYIKNRKKYAIVCLVLMVAVIVGSVVFGVDVDTHLLGGSQVTYSYTGEVNAEQAQAIAVGVAGEGTTVETSSGVGGSKLIVRLPHSSTLSAQALDDLTTQLQSTYPDAEITQLQVDSIQQTKGLHFLFKSLIAVVAALLFVFLWVTIRYRSVHGWRAAFASIVALVFDFIMVYGAYVFMRQPLNEAFVAILIVLTGYAFAKLVVFARVRENLALHRKDSFVTNMNRSMNQSMRRVVMASVAAVLALASACVVSGIYGLSGLFAILLPLTVGVMASTFSTVGIACPQWTVWENNALPKNKRENLNEAQLGAIEAPKRDTYSKRGEKTNGRKGTKFDDDDEEDVKKKPDKKTADKKAKPVAKNEEAEADKDDEEQDGEEPKKAPKTKMTKAYVESLEKREKNEEAKSVADNEAEEEVTAEETEDAAEESDK